MCLILDTNRFGDALSAPPAAGYLPLLQWLLDPDSDGVLVWGGSKYRGEVDRVEKARRFFLELSRAGRTLSVPDAVVDAEQAKLSAAGACASDDEHVVALARVSGARVVCTEDQALWRDVGNKDLLDHPRGRVYRTANHGHLLHHDPGCRKPPAKAASSRKRGRPRE